jgi:hypothetical protein
MNIDTNRTSELRQMLMARRLELGGIVHSGIRDGASGNPRTWAISPRTRRPYIRSTWTCLCSSSSADGQAHRRGADAAGRRSIRDLRGVRPRDQRSPAARALPFAVRCTRCEDRREENETGSAEFAKRAEASPSWRTPSMLQASTRFRTPPRCQSRLSAPSGFVTACCQGLPSTARPAATGFQSPGEGMPILA